MEVTTSRQDGRVLVTVLHISGRLDANSSRYLLERATSEHLQGAEYMLLDLTNTQYINSDGLRAIQSIFDLLRKNVPQESDEARKNKLHGSDFKSSRLKLLNPSKSVYQILTISGFDMYLEIHKDLQSAIASF